jgi:tRNA A-37 threonylcarbamoyl transferase component Bud32
MMPIKIKNIGRFSIGHTNALNDEDIDGIMDVLQKPAENADSVLGGRRKVKIAPLPTGQTVAVKQYVRGGLLHLLVKETYFRVNNTRAEAEFKWLADVRRLGIFAPEPLAFVFKGRRLYNCWLITREIKHHQTLVDICLSDIPRTSRLIPRLIDQTLILIQNNIRHVDFHPGNVLVDDTDTLFLIDFDKTRIFNGEQRRLARHYVLRWSRAVKKHKLPDFMGKAFHEGLMDHF